MSVIVWVHEGCLSPTGPALAAHPASPALFVFDEAYLRRERYTLKRIGFLYECLLDLPVTIRKGDTLSELRAFAQQHGADRIVTTDTVCPWHRGLIAALKAEVVPMPALVEHPGPFDLTRFSRFWRQAEKFAYGR
ncbi:MAG: hypothetical protein SNJ82_14045 [Gemmataceae bacterium]